MVLAIDIGNSQIGIGLGGGGGWRARWRLSSQRQRTGDEYGVLLRDLFQLDGLDVSRVEGVVVCSTVPVLTPVITAMCRRVFGRAPLLVEPGVHTGMMVRYNPPTSLGADRLVDAVAARHRFGAPVIVVDFGTATTFNVVDAAGTFIGGAIAPGLGLAAAALAEAGARLSRIDLAPPTAGAPPLIGRTTEQSMRSGIVYGYAGLVEGLLTRIESELAAQADLPGQSVPVVATGGMAPLVAPLVPRISAAEPDLILDGLSIVFGLNLPTHEA